MSFSRYDKDRARTSHHTHCCIGARRATHCATGDDNVANATHDAEKFNPAVKHLFKSFVLVCMPDE